MTISFVSLQSDPFCYNGGLLSHLEINPWRGGKKKPRALYFSSNPTPYAFLCLELFHLHSSVDLTVVFHMFFAEGV